MAPGPHLVHITNTQGFLGLPLGGRSRGATSSHVAAALGGPFLQVVLTWPALEDKLDEAKEGLHRALALPEELRDQFSQAAALINLGIVDILDADSESAIHRFQRALIKGANMGSTYVVVSCPDGLAAAVIHTDLVEAITAGIVRYEAREWSSMGSLNTASSVVDPVRAPGGSTYPQVLARC
jgi:hypothetical protein